MSEEPLTVAQLERLATTAEGYATAGGHTFWFATVARVCRHALALEAEVARLRRQVEGHCERIFKQSELLSRRAERHEVHEDDGEQ
jgi:hypothetical protein